MPKTREDLVGLIKRFKTPIMYRDIEIMRWYVPTPQIVNDLADYLIANGVVISPCKEGDTVYKIKKFCDENTGYMEFYTPSKEFDKPCPHYEPAEWECAENCKIGDDGSYCSQYLDIRCEKCKERTAIQAAQFDFSMLRKVFNTPMFDESTQLRNTFFLTKEEAEAHLPQQPAEGDGL